MEGFIYLVAASSRRRKTRQLGLYFWQFSSPMENEERLLMARESQKHEEKIRKSSMREIMFRAKQRGYDAVSRDKKVLLKVFMGYLCGIGAFSNSKLIRSLLQCIKNGDECDKIVTILRNKIRDQESINQVLAR